MKQPYDYRNCQSLFGYAQKVHERSGGVCQLCDCGAGSSVDFDLWRQMTVEHIIGQSQGGYFQDVQRALVKRFPDFSKGELEQMALKIDKANTITACSFCNSTTSRDRASKSMSELINEVSGGPDEVVAAIVHYLSEVHEHKRQTVAWKLQSVREAFEKRLVQELIRTRRRRLSPMDHDDMMHAHFRGQFLCSSISWPSKIQKPLPNEKLSDLYRGCLLWGAVGDALGRAVEGLSPAKIREIYGPSGLQDYQPWYGWRAGPVGTITDDTQLTMEVARSLLATRSRFDPEDFAKRLASWLPHGRGVGRATFEAVEGLVKGEPWWSAGKKVNSGGNGAAMRAAPVGLAWALQEDPRDLCRDAVLSALPTHTHPVAVAGAVAIATGVAWCIRERLGGKLQLDERGFLEFLDSALEGLESGPTMERRPSGRGILLRERIAEIDSLLRWQNHEDVFQYTYNGAFALESVPAAIYTFLRTPDDPRQVILTAVNAGFDADTVASMAGNLVGTWCGVHRLQSDAGAWWSELEYRDELIRLADDLLDLALEKLDSST